MADNPKNFEDDDYIEIKIPGDEAQPEKEAPRQPKPATKKAPKKTAKNGANKPITPKKEPRKAKAPGQGNNTWLWAVLLIIGLAVIAAVIYLSLKDTTFRKQEQETSTVVAALVNGQPIYASDVDNIYDRLPEQIKSMTSKEEILDQLIEQKLLLSEAEKQKIKVTDAELGEYMDELMSYFGINEEQLNSMLEAEGISVEDFEQDSRNQILVSKLINKSVYAKIIITDDEVEAHYESNKALYLIPETATVRHILISPEENETDEELEQRAEEVADMIADDYANFCDLVGEYTDDPGSVASCGEYKVAQDGYYVKEFEDAAFDIDVNETIIVQSQFGYHIIWKVAMTEAGLQPLEEVEEEIRALLFQERAQPAVLEFIDVLYDEAVIEKYPEQQSAKITVPLTPEEEEEQEEEMKVEVEKTKPVRTGDFGKCLTDAGAVLYGVEWAPDVQEQKDILAEAFDQVSYVDCDAGDAPAACDGIAVWPTWIIDGDVTLKGKQSVNALARETGCTP